MTEFDDIFRDNALAVHGAFFGERIIFRPHDGAPRVIEGAIVHRFRPAGVGLSERVITAMIEIEVPNDPDIGIEYHSLDCGSDRVDVAAEEGGALETRSIDDKISGFAGITYFKVQ
jgi:hypothetical protein